MIAVFPAPGAPVMMNLLMLFPFQGTVRESEICSESHVTLPKIRAASAVHTNGLGSLLLIQAVEHCLFQGSNGRVASSADASLGHVDKQSFHQVQPTASSLLSPPLQPDR